MWLCQSSGVQHGQFTRWPSRIRTILSVKMIRPEFYSNFFSLSLQFPTFFDHLWQAWILKSRMARWSPNSPNLPLSFEFKPAIWEWRISESDFSLIVNLAPEKSWQIGDFLSYRNHRCGLCESHPIWFCNDSNCGLDSTVTPTRDKLCWAFSALSWHRT